MKYKAINSQALEAAVASDEDLSDREDQTAAAAVRRDLSSEEEPEQARRSPRSPAPDQAPGPRGGRERAAPDDAGHGQADEVGLPFALGWKTFG